MPRTQGPAAPDICCLDVDHWRHRHAGLQKLDARYGDALVGLKPVANDALLFVKRSNFHGASFDVTNGEVLSPPAYENLTCFPVRVTDSAIEVEI